MRTELQKAKRRLASINKTLSKVATQEDRMRLLEKQNKAAWRIQMLKCLQLDALRKAGCGKNDVFTDKVSGAKTARPGLDQCLRKLKPGDTLLVWRQDRLGRSMRHLLDLVDDLRQRGVGFKSLCESIDTTTPGGKLVFHIFTALAEFERALTQERTRAGLESARARGRRGGRKPIAPDDPRVQTAKTLHADRKLAVADICKTLRISRATLYRYLGMN